MSYGMTPKPNRSVRLTERQWNGLKAEAELLGISIGELIRRIIDQHLEGKASPPCEPSS